MNNLRTVYLIKYQNSRNNQEFVSHNGHFSLYGFNVIFTNASKVAAVLFNLSETLLSYKDADFVVMEYKVVLHDTYTPNQFLAKVLSNL